MFSLAALIVSTVAILVAGTVVIAHVWWFVMLFFGLDPVDWTRRQRHR